MGALDLLTLAFVAVLALWGYAQGLLAGALALLGFAAGAALGLRLGPDLLEGVGLPTGPLVTLVAALLAGTLLALTLQLLGTGLRGRLPRPLRLVDRLAGAGFLAALGLGLVWLLGSALLAATGAGLLSHEAQRSVVLRTLDQRLPPSPPSLSALERIGSSLAGEPSSARAVSGRISRRRGVLRAAESVVRVTGTACGLGVQGSGWVADDGLVVTNAHVVAGQRDTLVQLAGRGPRHLAETVWFDARNDLAVLRAPGLRGARALPIAPASSGASAAILGFPQNGRFEVRAARIGSTYAVTGQDAYGRGPLRRPVTEVRGRVSAGYSGGPVVDARGRVVATIFASAVSRGRRGGFGVPTSIAERGLARASGPVVPGACRR